MYCYEVIRIVLTCLFIFTLQSTICVFVTLFLLLYLSWSRYTYLLFMIVQNIYGRHIMQVNIANTLKYQFSYPDAELALKTLETFKIFHLKYARDTLLSIYDTITWPILVCINSRSKILNEATIPKIRIHISIHPNRM